MKLKSAVNTKMRTGTYIYYVSALLVVGLFACALFIYNVNLKKTIPLQAVFDFKQDANWKNNFESRKRIVLNKSIAENNSYISYSTGEGLNFNYCKYCAFVVPSGNLIGKSLGIEIDSYPCVIRLNISPTSGFEADVGYRTTIRFISRNILTLAIEQLKKEIKENKKIFDPHFIKKSIVVQYGYKRSPIIEEILQKWPDIKLYYIKTERQDSINEMFLPIQKTSQSNHTTWGTNGFHSLNLAQDFCQEIHVYGMSEPNHCEKVKHGERRDVKYHYFLDVPDLECDVYKNMTWLHEFVKEKHFYAKDFTNKKIFFHKPDWKF